MSAVKSPFDQFKNEDKPIKLVVVAADGGYMHNHHLGIVKGYEQGIITTVSLITNGPWFHKMAEYLNDNPNLTPGIHLNLAGGMSPFPIRPACNASDVPSLVDSQGFLYDSVAELEEKQQPRYEDVVKEFRAQIIRAYQEGLNVGYVDNHVALNEDSVKAMYKVAEEYCLPIKREAGEVDIEDTYSTPTDLKGKRLAQYLDEKATKPGVYLYRCHPGFDTPEARSVAAGNLIAPGPEWAMHRQAETDACLSKEVLEVIKRKDIQLVGHYKGVRDEMRSKLPAADRESLLAKIKSFKAPRDPQPTEPFTWDGTPVIIARTNSDVAIDGNLSKYEHVPPTIIDGSNKAGIISNNKQRWDGSKNLGADIRLMLDEKYLYIGVKVNDDKPIQNNYPHYEVVRGDSVELFFRSDPTLAYIKRGKVKLHSSDRKITIAPTYTEGKPIVLIGLRPLDHESGEIIALQLDDGYIMEARVALSQINAQKWKKGDKIRMELTMNDSGGESEQHTRLYWQADDRKAWCNPDKWGLAEIQ